MLKRRIWFGLIGAALASGVAAQQYATIIDNLPTCVGNRNGRVISVSDAVDEADCTVGGAVGDARVVHQCICDTLNVLGPYWKSTGGSGGAGVSDGDKGDITVASSGAAWTVDANAVALGTDTTGGYASSATEAGEANTLAPAVVIEGATADAYEGNVVFTDPTADWTWTWSGTGGVSGVPSITGGASGSSTLTLDGDSTVTGSLVIDGAGKSAPSGGIDLRTSQSTPLNVILRAGSSGTGYFYLGSNDITGYDSPVVVDGGASLQIMGAGGVLFEGTTDNSNETKLAATDPTADRTITLPNATGTVGTFVAAPAAATDACVAGQYAVATGFAYFCVSANTWERVPIATW